MARLLLTLASFFGVGAPVYSQEFFDPQKAAEMVARGKAILVDVREADEIRSGMAEPAVWFPTSKIREGGPELEEFLDTFDQNKTIIVYCGSGRRAAYFVELLRERGFQTENMGGFIDWVEAGLPTIIPHLP